MKTDVSVLVLTYNHENFIAQTIHSLLEQQTEYEFEIVIGEDKSTDRTFSICKSYAEQYPEKIKLFSHQKNLGETRNFATTLELCRGKYLAFCEGDDFWISRGKIQQQVNYLERNPEFAIHFTECRYANGLGKLMGYFSQGRGLEHKKDSQVLLQEILESPLRPIHISSCMMRRSLVKLPPSYDQTPILDTPFLFYNASKGEVFFSSEVTTAYRKHSESITSQNTFSNDYLEDLTGMFKRLDEELDFQYTDSICTAIANRHILSLRSKLKESWTLSNILKLFYYTKKSKSFNMRDCVWMIKNRKNYV